MSKTNNITFSIDKRVSVFAPYEKAVVFINFLVSLAFFTRLKKIVFTADEEKLSVEGPKTICLGDFRLDVKKRDFRGSSVNFRNYNLFGIIISVLIIGLAIFAYIVFFADLFGNDEEPGPIIGGTILLILGIIILIFSLLKVTIITLRFVDKYSNSVRYLKIKVRRNAKDYYQTAKEFTDHLWKSSALVS